MRVLLILAAAAPLFAAGFTGPQACAACHPSQAKQLRSRHANALRPARGLEDLLNARPLQERSGVSYQYGPENVIVRQGDRRVEAPLLWAFGAGGQAITPVGRFRQRWFEHRISYYRDAGHGARTMGHPGAPASTPEAGLGLPLQPETAFRCFNCHAAGVRQTDEGPDLAAMLPGVTCERCHGPGEAHRAAVIRERPRPEIRASIERPDARSSPDFCASCHRSPVPGQADLSDPMHIRFQPVGLAASKCFQRSGKLSCLTCHDPHGDAESAPEPYIAACRQCHSAEAASASECPRAAQPNCLPCHMPRSSPAPFLTFTDHRIRVVRQQK